jgi:predicted ATP-binding protein involved in virulence
MKILKIELHDFRCFKTFDISFNPNFNTHVIIAENMVGKSALMSALRLSANTYTSGLKSEWQLQINDHRIIGNNPISDISPEVSITTTASITNSSGNQEKSKWKKYKTKPKGEKTKVEILDGSDPRKESKSINKLVAEGKAIQPLFSYIGTEYIHVESSDTVEWQIDGKSIDGYKGCFEDKSIKKFLFKWLSRIDSILNEISRKPIVAETYSDLPENAMFIFKKAVTSILPEISEIDWSADMKQPIVKLKSGEIRPFDVLSDGYRYLILLAGELATRAFILNKHLRKNVLNEIFGLVIIDEFGIHLHPALQNDTLINLQATFPNVQFIVSTHSPLLLNGLKKEQVHILTIDAEGQRIATNPEEDIIGLGANEILTKIFGLSTTMDNEFIEMNEEYTKLFKKKSEKIELEADEIIRFEKLSKSLSHLRLDPTLKITTEDPITTIIKEELANRNSLESFAKSEQSSENLRKEVDDILKNLFTNKK